jgi:hypothetical protein
MHNGQIFTLVKIDFTIAYENTVHEPYKIALLRHKIVEFFLGKVFKFFKKSTC